MLLIPRFPLNALAHSLTSGGTESILCAVKAYRELARSKRPHVRTPNMICPVSIHPAFEKAAHYFGVEVIHVGLTADCRVDVAAVAAAINSNTILLVGSAPQYSHGVIDPIEALAVVAKARGLPLHVDACFGGFMLPWLEKIGVPTPLWDFRVDGVTSISADVHKYGYSSKGASVVCYKNDEIRLHQYFAYAEYLIRPVLLLLPLPPQTHTHTHPLSSPFPFIPPPTPGQYWSIAISYSDFFFSFFTHILHFYLLLLHSLPPPPPPPPNRAQGGGCWLWGHPENRGG
jgi:glutamate/tyrosine decarboxylase-like PLP-dependent enzyme